MTNPLVVNGVDLCPIRNKNEVRVAALMNAILAERQDYKPDVLDIQDIYALTLNMLPSRYIQRGSIVLNEPVNDKEIEACIAQAIRVVSTRPNY